ncbi:hypothetical protein NDU88_000416 [Pleurodeles waltl]|uniref:Uncharacterized protein n=1 Tax=Pleurodeles waltl TaxID=8319 RepID=A0AAV7VW15_PLEWA|nr:hypothetical protein NDU88_000416 [Pleurodeles waltl]
MRSSTLPRPAAIGPASKACARLKATPYHRTRRPPPAAPALSKSGLPLHNSNQGSPQPSQKAGSNLLHFFFHLQVKNEVAEGRDLEKASYLTGAITC